MLMISDLLDVARGRLAGPDLRLRGPMRYGGAARRAPVVVWNVNRRCNMTCPHCYIAAGPRPVKDELSTTEALALLEDLAAAGVHMLIVSGGEPLLRPDALELLQHADALGLAPNLSTNGTLIDAIMAERLAQAGVRYVGISIDGPPEFNDAYRGLDGAYGLALRGLRAAKAAGLRTGLRMTLTRDNVQHLEEMFAVAQHVGADRFYVSHLVYSGRGYRLAARDLDAALTRGALHRLFVLAAAQPPDVTAPRIVTGSNDSDGALLLEWIRAHYGAPAAEPVHALLRDRGGNSAGEGLVAIDNRGRVHPDQFWQRAELGDVRRTPFAEILQHPLCAMLRRRSALLTGRCGTCTYLDICRGSHRERALARHGDMWASDPACVMSNGEITPLAQANAMLERAP